jgi:cell division septation protein DedD
MSDQQTAAVATTKPNGLSVKAQMIDRIASQAMSVFEGAASFEQELAVAQSIRDLRAALTPEIMAPVMALMNTDLGFVTDRDPKKSKQGQSVQTYDVETVRDVLIEAKLRGFHAVGNEFNIIASRFYAARNGLKRRCETYPGVTDLKIVVGLPRINGDQATVAIYGEWRKDGVEDKMTAPGGKPLEVLVRVNNFMGPDAIVGKAERKLYKRILDRLSGKVTPDGEVGDTELQSAKNVTPPPPPPPAPGTAATPPPTTDEKAEADAGLAPEQSPQSAPEPSGNVGSRLGDYMQAAGIDWETFSAYGRKQGWKAPWDNVDGFESLGVAAMEATEGFWTVRERIAKQIAKARAEGRV